MFMYISVIKCNFKCFNIVKNPCNPAFLLPIGFNNKIETEIKKGSEKNPFIQNINKHMHKKTKQNKTKQKKIQFLKIVSCH